MLFVFVSVSVSVLLATYIRRIVSDMCVCDHVPTGNTGLAPPPAGPGGRELRQPCLYRATGFGSL